MYYHIKPHIPELLFTGFHQLIRRRCCFQDRGVSLQSLPFDGAEVVVRQELNNLYGISELLNKSPHIVKSLD